MRIYLVRIPRRQGHSSQRDVLLAFTISGRSRRIHGPNRVGPSGRDLKSPHGNSDRTTGRIWVPSSPLCLFPILDGVRQLERGEGIEVTPEYWEKKKRELFERFGKKDKA
jgi:hypothetical protein